MIGPDRLAVLRQEATDRLAAVDEGLAGPTGTAMLVDAREVLALCDADEKLLRLRGRAGG